MSRFTSFFKAFFSGSTVKMILKLGEQILKVFLGNIADKLQTVANEEVVKAEATGASGLDKYEQALKGIRLRFPEIKESVINFAIENAVLALLAAKEKR